MPEVSWYAVLALLLAVIAVILSVLIPDYPATSVCVALLGVVLAVLSLRDN